MRSIFIAAVLAFASSIVLACSGSDATAPTGEGQGQETNEPASSSGSSGASPSGGGSSSGASSSGGGSSSGGSTSSSSSSGGADAGHDSGTSNGGKADLGGSCKSDADCKSNVCFVGGSQSYCSLRCTSGNAASVCVPPTFDGQCNKQGYCRLP